MGWIIYKRNLINPIDLKPLGYAETYVELLNILSTIREEVILHQFYSTKSEIKND